MGIQFHFIRVKTAPQTLAEGSAMLGVGTRLMSRTSLHLQGALGRSEEMGQGTP